VKLVKKRKEAAVAATEEATSLPAESSEVPAPEGEKESETTV